MLSSENGYLLSRGGNRPTFASAVGELTDTLKGRQHEARLQAQHDEDVQRAYLLAALHDRPYSEVKQAYTANGIKVDLPDLPPSADEAIETEVRRIVNTPDEQLQPKQRLVKFARLSGHAIGDVGNTAVTNESYNGMDAAKNSALVAGGLKESANAGAKRTQEQPAVDALVAARTASAGASNARAKNYTEKTKNTVQLRDVNSPVVQTQIKKSTTISAAKPQKQATSGPEVTIANYLKRAANARDRAAAVNPETKGADALKQQLLDQAAQWEARANQIRMNFKMTSPQAESPKADPLGLFGND